MKVTQFGSGITYETEDYPYVVLNTRTKKVYGRFSTLDKAHKGRLMTALNNPNEMGVMLFNEKTKKFLDWRKEELQLFEKYKHDPSKYFESMRAIKIKRVK